jgi:vacuolar protein-sorting-associated protein 4
MTDPSVRRKQLNSYIVTAKSHEENEDYEEAFDYYIKAINVCHLLYKYENVNKSLKEKYKIKLDQIVGRAEEIKEFIHKASKKKVKVGTNGKHKDSSSDEESKEDDELMKGLESAIVEETPNVKWDDVAGLDTAKSLLREAVILPIEYPQLFKGKRKPWTGILLYGPPGTGKTFLAKACATEAQSTFITVTVSDLLSKFLGDTEKQVRNLFEMARKRKPSIIFIDEIDSVCGERGQNEHETMRRVKNEILQQMDGVKSKNKDVLVLGATNLPWEIDKAMRRRFKKKIYISLPDEHSRKEIIKYNLDDTPHDLSDEEFEELASLTDGFSGADLEILTQDAVMVPLRKCQEATKFIKTEEGHFIPTYASDPNGIEATMAEIDKPLLEAPPV